MPDFSEEIQVDGQPMELYVSVPEGSGPFPAIVVPQHSKGAGDFIRGICARLTGEGYVAVAPDLDHRITEAMQAEGKTHQELKSDPNIVADINAAVEFLRRHRSVDRERLGITGFCMGGRVTWLAAATNPYLKAAVPHYGSRIMQAWETEKSPFQLSSGIRCPILFHFGELDSKPSQAEMGSLDAELTRLGKSHRFHTYAKATHGFMDATGDRYQKEAAETSWARTLDFFATYLKQAAVATR